MTISVLLADDHLVLRDGLRFILDAEADIHVIGDASTGTEAVQATLRFQPDIVLMDITMPELNGIEATHEICQQYSGAKIIILSMHSSIEHILRALRAGAKGYLLKESAGAEVVSAVHSVYEGHCYFSTKISDTLVEQHFRKSATVANLDPLSKLSHRERQVLQLVADGKSNAEIAEMLFLSPKTVETYRSRLMRKLEIDDLATLVKFAIKQGMTSIE
jgi:DNA-binding NarL/FixJ family response regulator